MTSSEASSGSTFRDLFSHLAAKYAEFRPRYPDELFDWLAAQTTAHELAWDAGAGTGQASVALARHYRRVIATDASVAQIAAARPHERVEYRVATSEQSGLTDASADLVVVAQALHWFDVDRFYREVRRVAKPGGVVAAWTYGHVATGDATIDGALDRFYRDTVGQYWPPERRHVDAGYRTLPFEFPAITVPPLAMTATWALDELLGYIATWSAVARYAAATGTDPIPLLRAELEAAWGGAARRRVIRWPLSVRAGRCD